MAVPCSLWTETSTYMFTNIIDNGYVQNQTAPPVAFDVIPPLGGIFGSIVFFVDRDVDLNVHKH